MDNSWDHMYKSFDYEDKMLNTKEVAELLSLSTTTLEHMRVNGGGPPFVNIGRSVRYRLSDIYRWMEMRKSYQNTSQPKQNEA